MNLLQKIIRYLKKTRVIQAIYSGAVILGLKKDSELLKRIMPHNGIVPLWLEGDNLSLTKGWYDINAKDTKITYNRNSPPKILFLNSLGGSVSRLARALMIHQNVSADCYVNAYFPKRNLNFPLETNVNGVFSDKEWREFISWAICEYDIIQSSGLPLKPGLAECYSWLTDKLGSRHIWRSTGFVHHYIHREEILPLSIYQNDLATKTTPSRDKFPSQIFPVRDNYFEIGDTPLFYSSPEKGAYFKGNNKIWLPSIRNPQRFITSNISVESSIREGINIYIPIHRNAIFKGLDTIIAKLKNLQRIGHKFNIITPENAHNWFPYISVFRNKNATDRHIPPYPIPNHFIPKILQNVDIVIDQIVMGSYGNTGIEAMMSGLPVIGQKRYHEIVDSPIIDTDISNFEEKFLGLLYSPETWNDLGQKGRRWAMKYHSPKSVAKVAFCKYLEILQNNSGEF